MSRGVTGRQPRSPAQFAASPLAKEQSGLSPLLSGQTKTPTPRGNATSPASTGGDAFPGMLSRSGSLVGSSVTNLPQVEALEAADAIDAVLRKMAEPVHERLKESLVQTLRSRAKVSRSLHEIDVESVSAARGHRTGLTAADISTEGVRFFGKQLAASWTSLPDTGLDGGRSRLLEKLDGTQAARLRGLLTHLEFAVQADPSLTVAGLLKDDSPTPLTSPLLPGYESPREEHCNESPVVAVLPQVDPWPYERFRLENRSACSGKRFDSKIDGTAGQRLMSFRDNLCMGYNSLGEAFAAMDMDGRGCISFDHFHAHLVRLKLSRVDAEGSIRAVELFKLLDADGDDLITPNDCLRSFEAAARSIHKELNSILVRKKLEKTAQEHGYEDGSSHIRFDKHLRLTGDEALRISTLRRFFELQGQTFIEGLRALDEDRTGFLRKEAFVCGLIEGGYCVSASEAMDLFQVLDVHKTGSLSLRYLELLDESERLGATHADHRPPASPRGGTPGSLGVLDHPHGHQLRSGIGSGGLFSDPGRLDGPKPPPRPHARLEQLREWSPDEARDLHSRLHLQTTIACKSHQHVKKRESQMPGTIINELLKNLEEDRVLSPAQIRSEQPTGATSIGVSTRGARTDARNVIRAASPDPPGSPSPRDRGKPPPAVGPPPRGAPGASPSRVGPKPKDIFPESGQSAGALNASNSKEPSKQVVPPQKAGPEPKDVLHESGKSANAPMASDSAEPSRGRPGPAPKPVESIAKPEGEEKPADPPKAPRSSVAKTVPAPSASVTAEPSRGRRGPKPKPNESIAKLEGEEKPADPPKAPRSSVAKTMPDAEEQKLQPGLAGGTSAATAETAPQEDVGGVEPVPQETVGGGEQEVPKDPPEEILKDPPEEAPKEELVMPVDPAAASRKNASTNRLAKKLRAAARVGTVPAAAFSSLARRVSQGSLGNAGAQGETPGGEEPPEEGALGILSF